MQASQKGLVQIKQAITQKGWKVGDDRWLMEASEILEPSGKWQIGGPYAYGCSLQTWERFLQGTPIRDRSFIAFCQVLDITPSIVTAARTCLREDWGEAPDIGIFYGRERELETLNHWIFREECRLIEVNGFAGMGKTRLVKRLLDKAVLQPEQPPQSDFEFVIWRRMNARSPEDLLHELLFFLCNQDVGLAVTVDAMIRELLRYLSCHRCLLVLDNVESILCGGDQAGCYRSGYEPYTELFLRLGETAHQSCVLLLSRERVSDVEALEFFHPVRSLRLEGLDSAIVQDIFQVLEHECDLAFYGSSQDWKSLVTIYGGNPLLLESAAKHILRQFDGSIPRFLEHGSVVFGRICRLLDWHFERLSRVQKKIIAQIVLTEVPVSLASLKCDVCYPRSQRQAPEILDNLERQMLLMREEQQLTVLPILAEYVRSRLTFCLGC